MVGLVMLQVGRLQSTVTMAVSVQVALKLALRVLLPSGRVMLVNFTSAPWTVLVATLAVPTIRSTLVPSGWLVAMRMSVLKPPVQVPPMASATVSVAVSAGEMNDPEQMVATSLPPPSLPPSGLIWAFGLLSPQPAGPAKTAATKATAATDERPSRLIFGIKLSSRNPNEQTHNRRPTLPTRRQAEGPDQAGWRQRW